ncbi:MAG: DNA polymerase III subunit gamma/tau, partial [Alphaproteobacteria bacterium]
SGYRVLARKYRPQRFSELVGQEAMVRTLANALRSGRVAHAYLLTGVRGVGKTTTARIIARALNCTGRDASAGEVEPCGSCEACQRIAESRHVDVIEMDAASRTGVDDIREIIDSVAYAPVSARYKVYIIDEVHMLSRSAFNALLKTLEEPPPHVIFIFATTEIHKVPVTVLSRCQRFDLKRVPPEVLIAHLKDIAAREQVTVSDEALAVIARISEGSVRDALSLLDQAIAFAGAEIDEETVRGMLGLADHVAVIELLAAALTGRAQEVLTRMTALRTAGQDPVLLMTDLLDALHWLTRMAVTPEARKDPLRGPAERQLAERLVGDLDMGRLQRAWQMLLKGLEEVRTAPQPMDAAEMALLRVAHAASLPTPAEALAWLKRQEGGPAGAGGNRAGEAASARGEPARSDLLSPAPSAAGAPAAPAPVAPPP